VGNKEDFYEETEFNLRYIRRCSWSNPRYLKEMLIHWDEATQQLLLMEIWVIEENPKPVLFLAD